jgi:hypothetical protein
VALQRGRPLDPALRDFNIRQAMIQAQTTYAPKPYPGRITFFHAGERPARYYHDPFLNPEAMVAAGFASDNDQDPLWQAISKWGWGQLAEGGLEVVQVPGPHGFMVRDPYAQALAEALRSYLMAAHGAEG